MCDGSRLFEGDSLAAGLGVALHLSLQCVGCSGGVAHG